jgi:AmmeMemoRadiSam system protein B
MICSGSFYPADRAACEAAVNRLISVSENDSLCRDVQPVAAVVPHAGWEYCGDVIGEVFSRIKGLRIDTFLLFGAVHMHGVLGPLVYDGQAWETPLGKLQIDREIAVRLLESGVFSSDVFFHSNEHSLEVAAPFIRGCFPDSKICAVLVPPNADALLAGRIAAEVAGDGNVFCIASSDLTHYGKGYDFEPAGCGEEGYIWAKEINDRSFLNSVISLEAQACLSKGVNDRSACGAGAVAAAVEYARSRGSTEGILLKHTHSCEVLGREYLCTTDSTVGYAGILL